MVMFTSVWFVGSDLLLELNLINMIFLEVSSPLILTDKCLIFGMNKLRKHANGSRDEIRLGWIRIRPLIEIKKKNIFIL